MASEHPLPVLKGYGRSLNDTKEEENSVENDGFSVSELSKSHLFEDDIIETQVNNVLGDDEALLTPRSKVRKMLQQLDEPAPVKKPERQSLSLLEKLKIQLGKTIDEPADEPADLGSLNVNSEDIASSDNHLRESNRLFLPSSPLQRPKQSVEQPKFGASSLGTGILDDNYDAFDGLDVSPLFKSPSKRRDSSPDRRESSDHAETPKETTFSSPRRRTKAPSKKEKELTARESLRMERQLQLAPEMHTTKFASVQDFINGFDSSDMTSSPKSLTPVTSPVSSPKKQLAHGTPKTPDVLRKTPKKKVEATPRITPRRLTSYVKEAKKKEMAKKSTIAENSREFSDSDSELEIVPTTAASVMPKALRKLGNLAKVDIYTNTPKNSKMFSVLASKQLQQAKTAHQERVEELKKKGININEEANIKEKEMLEDLLEKERRKADELARFERPEGKDILDDDEIDLDYEENGNEPYRSENESEDENPEEPGDDDAIYRSENESDEKEELEEAEHEERNEQLDTQEQPPNTLATTQDDDTQKTDFLQTQPVHSAFPILEVQSSIGGPMDDDQPIFTQRKRIIAISEDDESDEEAIASQENIFSSKSRTFASQNVEDFFGDTQPTNTKDLTPHGRADNQRVDYGVLDTQKVNPGLSDDEEDIYRGPRLAPNRNSLVEASPLSVADDTISSPVASPSPETPVKTKKLKPFKPKMKLDPTTAALFDQEADESEDEWAHLGGSDNEEEGSDVEGYHLADLVDDNAKEELNEAKIRQLITEKAINEDSELVQKLMQDVTTGGWRKRKAANSLLGADLFDQDEDNMEYMKQLAMRAERKRQKLLEEERLSEIVNNDKAKAFVDSIAEDTKMTSSFLDRVPVEQQSSETSEKSAEIAVSQPKSSTKKWSVDLIRQSLSFLDEKPKEDRTILEEQHETVLSQTTIFEDDEESYIPRKVVLVDRKASQVNAVISRETEDELMPPPKRSFRSTSSLPIAASIQSNSVQIVRSIPSSRPSSIKSSLVRRANPLVSPSSKKRVLEAKKHKPAPVFMHGGTFDN